MIQLIHHSILIYNFFIISYVTGLVFIQSFCDALKNEYNEVYSEVSTSEVKEKNKITRGTSLNSLPSWSYPPYRPFGREYQADS